MPGHYRSTSKVGKKKVKVSKKAGKAEQAARGTAVTKRFGKPVMKQDPKNPNRKFGYATVAKTQLPDYKPKKKKPTKAASRTVYTTFK
jgi:hypothetical protein